MEKLLSIVIPTYNMEKYLRNALSSLLIGEHQELLDAMIINDGSKDSSLEIAKSFEEKYPRVFRVIDKPNGNYGSCINRGLEEAKGKYIKVLDADDSYDTHAFAALVEKLMSIDADLVLTDYVIVDEQQNTTGNHIRQGIKPEQMYGADEFFAMCMNDVIMMHEIVYRTQNLREMNYHQTEGIAFTDAEWSLLPMTQVKKACYLNLSVYRYLVGRQGQTVDINRAAALQSQGDKTMFVQIEAYSKLKDISHVLRSYMKTHLSRNLRLTYRTYMMIAYKSLPNERLKEYDERLKTTNRELYDMIDSVRVQPSVPFHFIHEWRKAGGHPTTTIRFYRTVIHPLLRRLKLA